MAKKIKDQDLEISGLKAMVKILEDKDRGREDPQVDAPIKGESMDIREEAMVKILEDKDRGREDPQEDAPIKGESMDIREEVRVKRSIELGSNDTEEMINVLSAMEAANILTSKVVAISVSPDAAATIIGVPTVSGLVPTV
nr:hypothetical protein [Tanacetum cinerariifolium]